MRRVGSARRWIGVGAGLVVAGCASAPGPERGPVGRAAPEPLAVPHFAADDERVATAGFVSQTTRVSRDDGGTTFTLMIFAVGDVLTLGSMIEGDFEGTASWEVGRRRFSVPLLRSNRGATDVPVSGAPLEGQHGGFDAFDWVNVEVPLEEWLPDGTRLRLEFNAGRRSIVLPADGGGFVATRERR